MAGSVRFLRSLGFHVFKLMFDFGFHSVMRTGAWREALIQAVAPSDGDRILEVSGARFGVCAALASRYPSVHFAIVHPLGPGVACPPNVEYLHRTDHSIDCRAASFDKVVCSLALLALSPDKKLALLKEMRRVLRRGGTIYLADVDAPEQPREISALRGISHLFGPEAAKPHVEGTWLELIQRADFVNVERISSHSEMIARVSLIRARCARNDHGSVARRRP